jgi:hypothetical protein
VVEGSGLENRQGVSSRGFESPLFLHEDLFVRALASAGARGEAEQRHIETGQRALKRRSFGERG